MILEFEKHIQHTESINLFLEKELKYQLDNIDTIILNNYSTSRIIILKFLEFLEIQKIKLESYSLSKEKVFELHNYLEQELYYIDLEIILKTIYRFTSFFEKKG